MRLSAEFSLHLVFPFIASLLFVAGLILLKRATDSGTNPWTVSLIANLWAALLFSGFWLIDSTPVPWSLIWQPMFVALFYVGGQIGTFSAIHQGDVSVAAPVFGIKVLLVAVLSTLIGRARIGARDLDRIAAGNVGHRARSIRRYRQIQATRVHGDLRHWRECFVFDL